MLVKSFFVQSAAAFCIFLIIFLGYFGAILSTSTLISEWLTDRMLTNLSNSMKFQDIEKSSELKLIEEMILDKADTYSIIHAVSLIGVVISAVSFLSGLYLSRFFPNGMDFVFGGHHDPILDRHPSSLFVIFSTLFAVSLIFMANAFQIIGEQNQILFSTYLEILKNKEITTTLLPLIDSQIAYGSFEFFVEITNGILFGIISLTFLIASAIINRLQRYSMLSRLLVFNAMFSILVWIAILVTIIGFSPAPNEIVKQFSTINSGFT